MTLLILTNDRSSVNFLINFFCQRTRIPDFYRLYVLHGHFFVIAFKFYQLILTLFSFCVFCIFFSYVSQG